MDTEQTKNQPADGKDGKSEAFVIDRLSWPEERVNTESPQYKNAVAGFILRHRAKALMAETGEPILFSAAFAAEMIQELGMDETTPAGDPIFTEETIDSLLGDGGWDLPCVTKNGIQYFDLAYISASREEKSCIQVYLFGIDPSTVKCA